MINQAVLKKQIGSGNLKNIYVLLGDEFYQIEATERFLTEKLVAGEFKKFNYLKFYGKSINFDEIYEFCESFPLFSAKKLLVLKNCEVLSKLNAESQEKFIKIVQDLPNYVRVLIIDKSIDKRKKKLINLIEKNGDIVEFKKASKLEIERQIKKKLAEFSKIMSPENLSHFMYICNFDIGNAMNQLEKLINFPASEITKDTIDALVSRSIDVNVFDLIDEIIEKNSQKVFKNLRQLEENNEEPIVILSLILSNLSSISMVKNLMSDGLSPDEIKTFFEPKKKFLFGKFLVESKNFSKAKLDDAIKHGLKLDYELKTGKAANRWMALENYAGNLIYG